MRALAEADLGICFGPRSAKYDNASNYRQSLTYELP